MHTNTVRCAILLGPSILQYKRLRVQPTADSPCNLACTHQRLVVGVEEPRERARAPRKIKRLSVLLLLVCVLLVLNIFYYLNRQIVWDNSTHTHIKEAPVPVPPEGAVHAGTPSRKESLGLRSHHISPLKIKSLHYRTSHERKKSIAASIWFSIVLINTTHWRM